MEITNKTLQIMKAAMRSFSVHFDELVYNAETIKKNIFYKPSVVGTECSQIKTSCLKKNASLNYVLAEDKKEEIADKYYSFFFNDSTPEFEVATNAIYIPSDNRWNILAQGGLYSAAGELYKSSCLYRGGKNGDQLVTKKKNFDSNQNNFQFIKGSHIYMGPLVGHFGHFVTECISRLWYLLSDKNDNSKLVFHGNSEVFDVPFVKEFFGALGIRSDRLLVLDQPAILENVVIPYPSIINQSGLFEAHKFIPEKIASNILQKNTKSCQPVYLARTALHASKRKICGEQFIINFLKEKNVKVVRTEQLSITQQIKLINSHETIIGPIGSAHHLNLFALEPKKQIYLCKNPDINYLMLDIANKNTSYYVHCLDYQKMSLKKQPDYNFNMDLDIAMSSLIDLGVV